MSFTRLRGSPYGYAGMTPEEIAEVRPRLVEFTAQMLGGLARSDQRTAGQLYVRGLLTDGRRKSMQPMAERLGVDHQRLQQFITSSTWDYVAVQRNVARWFAGSQLVEALVVDDTGFPKDGTASPCVARQYSGTLGKVANCQIGVSVHLVSERASCAADWRLFCPESWDDAALGDPVAAARAACRRDRVGIPDEVRHTEKWRLALEMIEEMTGAGGWGVLEEITAAGSARPVVAADAGYGDNTTFRLELADRDWRYVAAVKGTTSAYPGDARPVTPARHGGPGRPPGPAYPGPPASLRQLAIASADTIRPVTWRQGTRATKGNPTAAMTSCFLAIRVRRVCDRAPGGLEAFEHQPHRHGSFSDGGRGPLDGPAADVTDGENSRAAGFQEQGHPAGVVEPGLRDVGAGEQEPVGVFGELARQPPGGGLGADEHEQAPDRQCRPLLPAGIHQLHAFQLVFPEQRGDLRSGSDGGGSARSGRSGTATWKPPASRRG